MKYKYFILFAICFLGALSIAHALPNGIVFIPGGEGCACHAEKSSTNTLVELINPIKTVAPGKKMSFEIRLLHPQYTRAGIAITIQDEQGRVAGSFQPIDGEGLKVYEFNPRQLVHEEPKAMQRVTEGNEVRWRFEWIAPQQKGEYTMYAIGNAVSKTNKQSTGDWTYLTPFTIKVDNSVAVEEQTVSGAEETLLYPHPARDYLVIELPDKVNTTVGIYNPQGELVLSSIASGKFVWNTHSSETGTSVASGMYLVVLSHDEKSKGRRVYPVQIIR